MPIQRIAIIPEQHEPSVSVPAGHRAKCRTCGAVDKVKLVGSRRLKRCAYCGSTLAMRRSPRKPKLVTYAVFFQLNGADYGMVACQDVSQAEAKAYFFVEHGPVARSRVAQVVKLIDNARAGEVRVLRYDNFRQKRSVTSWTSGCDACKGKGLIPTVMRPSFGDRKAVVKFLPCAACNALGGELTRRQAFGKRLVA